jgi:hypothetical protein
MTRFKFLPIPPDYGRPPAPPPLPELYGPFRITLSGAYGERTGYALDASRHLEKTHEQKMDDATKG